MIEEEVKNGEKKTEKKTSRVILLDKKENRKKRQYDVLKNREMKVGH